MNFFQQLVADLSSTNQIALAVFMLSLLIFIYSWVKRGAISAWEAKQVALEKRLVETPPHIEIEQNEKEALVIEQKYAEGKEVLDQLTEELQVLSSSLRMVDSGLYPPTFGYLDSEDLKGSIRAEREKQLQLIDEGNAVSGFGTFSLFGSKGKGKALVEDYQKVFLRTFNAEFEDIRKKLRMSNLESSGDKLFTISHQLESLGEVMNVEIGSKYLRAKSRELKVWAAEIEARNNAKEAKKLEQKLLREQKQQFKRDDEELDSEIEASVALLNEAKKRALELVGMTDQDVSEELMALEQEIADHEAKIEESMSEAQKTKAGYIYVISNVGSFGEGVFKIGMTRRLEPMDRVVELGDASVPFRFDVHTIAFVEDAPAIERQLHQRFNEYRVNRDNERKEFFETSIEEIRAAFDTLSIESDWYYSAEAREHSESKLMRAALSRTKYEGLKATYPEAI